MDSPINSGVGTLLVVPTETLESLKGGIDHLIKLVELHQNSAQPEARQDYDEPGPYSRRKWFTPSELMRRWSFGKTKVYEIPESELPVWKKGIHKRYFWAHVWAYEGRLSWSAADRLFEDHAIQATK